MLFLIITLRKKTILNIDRAFGIVRQFFLWLFVEPKVLARNAEVNEPLQTGVNPFLVRLFIFARPDEIFHLHLLELARAKDEVAGRYFVAKRLSNLGHTKR